MIPSRITVQCRTSHVQHFLGSLLKCSVPLKEHVQRRYAEHATLFEETSEFSVAIGWITESDGKLELTNSGKATLEVIADDEAIRRAISLALVAGSSHQADAMASYLRQFRLHGDELTHRPAVTDRILQSDLRNLMIDLNLVLHRPSDDAFALTDQGKEIYVWALNYGSRFAGHTGIIDFAAFGLQAELAVMQFERDRVGPKFAPSVVHVASENPFASYDIKSITLIDTTPEPRFIEVKAVSRSTFQFHWSAREVDTASALRNKYFLYLVPVGEGGVIDISNTWVIDNPLASIFDNPRSWTIEPDSYVCSRKLS